MNRINPDLKEQDKRKSAKPAKLVVSPKLPMGTKEQHYHSDSGSAGGIHYTNTRKLVNEANKTGSRLVEVRSSDRTSGVRTKMRASSRKRKRKGGESNEEEEFARMVDKYRRKLQHIAT